MSVEGKGQDDQNIEIKKTIIIDATPDVIFKALTDPAELTQWFPDQAIFEAKVGGKIGFDFSEKKPKKDDGCEVNGIITEFISNKKISYTWQNSKDSSEISTSVVTWELEKIKDDGTKVNLSHTGIMTRETAKDREGGWSYFLPRLKKYSEGR